MEDQQLLQQVLNSTLERVAKQSMNYEAEIANLNAQIILLKNQIAILESNINVVEKVN